MVFVMVVIMLVKVKGKDLLVFPPAHDAENVCKRYDLS
jgi:hypothetical protein